MIDGMPIAHWLHAALGGPGRFRFVLQPLFAVILGIRDGIRDSRDGAEPFLWGLVFTKGRRDRLKKAARQILIPLGIAIVLDSVLQFYLLRTVRLRWALFVALFLIALPYTIARALANRAASRMRGPRVARTPT